MKHLQIDILIFCCVYEVMIVMYFKTVETLYNKRKNVKYKLH